MPLPCSLGWSIERDLPPPSEHGGPLCQGSADIPLAPDSRRQLAAVLRGEAAAAQLLRPDTSSEETGDTTALYPLLWLLRGDLCASQPLHLREVLGDDSGSLAWGSQWVACNASLQPPPQPTPGAAAAAVELVLAGGSHGGAQQRRLAAASEAGGSAATWWQLGCWAVNATGHPVEPLRGVAQCSGGFGGPRWAALAAAGATASTAPLRSLRQPRHVLPALLQAGGCA